MNIVKDEMIGLIDCNNFFVSCERVFDPSLNDKPVAVLSCNDGCIVSRSNEVKQMGIPMGAPIFKFKKEVEKYGIILRSCNFGLYGDLSRRIMNTVRVHVKDMQVYSVDEAFIHLHEDDPKKIDEHISSMRKIVLRDTGIPVSIGIARTKTLAKMCTSIAKKNPNGNGCLLMMKEMESEYCKNFPIENVWGIGGKTTEKLKNNGIYTAYEFLMLPDAAVRKVCGLNGIFIAHELRGEKIHFIEMEVEKKKTITSSRSFGEDVTQYEIMRDALISHVEKITCDLYEQQSCCQKISVFVNVKCNGAFMNRYEVREEIVLADPTSNMITLLHAGEMALKKICTEKKVYKKIGVTVSMLLDRSDKQYSLFTNEQTEKRKENFSETIVDMKNKYGNLVRLGGVTLYKKLEAKKELVSRKFTKDWDELLEVNL